MKLSLDTISGIIHSFAYFRIGAVPFKFAMSNVNCKGGERTIQECLHRKFDFCGVNDGVQIECEA